MIQQRQISPQGCTDNTTSTTRRLNGTKPALGGILRKFLAILMLTTISISAWATDYVFVYNGNYLGIDANGNLTNYTSFQGPACVWTCMNGNNPATLNADNPYALRITYNGNTRYLYCNPADGTAGAAIITSTTVQNTWRLTNNRLNFRPVNWANDRYAYYRGDQWRTSNSSNPNYGDRNNVNYWNDYGWNGFYRTDYRATVIASQNTNAIDNTIAPTISCNGLSGSSGIIMIHSEIGGTYTPAATTIIVGGTTYYKGNDGVYSATAPSTSLDPSYRWSIQNGNASIGEVDGVLTVSGTGSITVRQTTTYAGSQTKTTDFTLNVNETTALNETIDPDISVTPTSAVLDLTGSTQVYEIPATLNRTRRTRDAYYTITPNGGNVYYKVGSVYAATQPAVAETPEPLALNYANWTPSGTGYTYFNIDGNGNRATLTRSANRTSENLDFTLTVVAHYGTNGVDVQKSATAQVAIPFSEVDLTSIYNCASSNTSLRVGESATLSFEYRPQDQGQGRPHVEIEYSSSAESVATVSSEGVVTAVGPGSAKITIQSITIAGAEGESCDVDIQVTTPAAQPTFSRSDNTLTITSTTTGVRIYYTTDGSTPTVNSGNDIANGVSITISSGQTIKAIAANTSAGYTPSTVATFFYGNGNSAASPYPVCTESDFAYVRSNPEKYYRLQNDITITGTFTSIDNFTGSFDGDYYTIKGLTQPLFETVTNATIKNVVLEAVSISSTATNVGPLVCTAGGNTVIYNCGVRNTYNTDPANKIYAGKKKADGRPTLTSQSTVSGGTNVGGLVGQLRGNAKVINCYSYANVIGGTNCAGIVGDRGDNGTEITNTTQVVIKHVSSGRLLTENNAALQIVTERNWGTWQYWYLEPTVGGYKLKNVGRGEYIAQGTANTWTAVFNTTGDVYTLVPQGNGIFYIHGSNGNLGTNNDNNESTVFTNKGTNDRNRWELYVNGQKVNSLNHTMVANCMFYGNITGGTNKYPVYGGTNIDNTKYPIYDYFKLDSISYRDNIAATNSALPAEARFLERFEYFRATLNSNKRLTAWYITGNSTQTDVVGKWVLDRAIAPFPIIKPWGKYPSLINPDYESNGQLTDINDSTQRYRGKVMGYLSVTINSGTQGGSNSKTIQIPISDMDTANYDFNYYKIQLPYYNDHWNNKYQAAKVVTGWRITSVTGETDGTWATTGTNAYNFADRNCTAKDLYSTSNRIFAEGGFYNVPEGVTAITIEANWANAVYVCDQYLDKVYNKSYTATNFTAAGGYGTTGFRNVTFTNIYNSLNNAYGSNTLTSSNTGRRGNKNVYDNAIVLIGNLNEYRGDNGVGNTDKGYTIMSIDMDGDNEPDFAQRYAHRDIRDIAPSRWDFVYQVGLSWIKKPYDAAMQAYSGIAHNLGHFEITETAFARYTEFETGTTGNSNSPLIFNGGLIDQFVVSRNNNNANVTYINYAILGGHTYFNAFTPGVHANYNARTQLFPVSVLGGEYAEFYLTGRKAEVEVDDDNHGRVYSNGGRIGTYCSGYWEQLNGNATIRFDHIIIDTFFGGSLNPAKPITGNIDIVINNSLVDFYCGGSKAGNMSANSSVHTVANNTVFGTFMGAGYGGSSVARFQQREHVSTDGSNDIGGVEYTYPKTQYMADYFKTANNNGQNNYLTYTANRGILIRYHIEYMPGSGGFNWADVDHPVQVTRWFNEYAQLSLARCYSVTSELNNCLVKGNFYGGACYGTVGTSTNTQTINSTLTNCTVRGNVHGAGKSAAIPSITVFPVEQSALVTPLYNPSLAIYYQPGCEKFPTYPQGTQYTWVSQTGTPTANTTNKTLGTDADLNNLGTVFGNINLTLDGGHMYGHVFGGGEASKVTGNTNVVVKGPIIVEKNVYGGGNAGEIGGDTQVTIGE